MHEPPCSGDAVRVPVSATIKVVVQAPRQLCWLLVASLHGLSIAYHGLMAVVYIHSAQLTAPFGPVKYVERVMIDRKYFRTIGVGAAVITTIHVLFLMRMIHASVLSKRLSFQLAVSRASVSSRVGTIVAATGSALGLHAKQWCIFSRRKIPRYLQLIIRLLSFLRFHLTNRQGLFGIGGPHFENVFLLRELFQIGFQSWQAWRMAERVPNPWLSHFNVVLVCLNCWSMPLLKWRFDRQHQRVGPTLASNSYRSRDHRLLTILVDCCLDSLGVSLMSLVTFLPYLNMLTADKKAFRLEFLLNDQWLTRAMNEFQIVFVVNWWDAVSRVMFALLTIVSLQAVHDLSHDHFEHLSNQETTQHQAEPTDQGFRKTHNDHPSQFGKVQRFVRVMTVLWGCAIASLHVHAALLDSPQNCALPLRPWGVRKPACAAIVLNCYRVGTAGSQESLEAVFETIASRYVSLIIIQHCAALEMPRTLKTHSRLVSLRIHNATLVRWDPDARLTGTANPMLRTLSFTRLTWPEDGRFPQGLLAEDPPSTVTQMNIRLSNLHALPSDLHERLPHLAVFSCDLCEFRTFPNTLLLLDAEFVSMAANNLTTVPLARLVAPGRIALVIAMSFNPLNDSIFDFEGLTNPAVSSRLRYLPLVNTSVTSVPSWFSTSPAVSQGPLMVLLGGSPYCAGEPATGIDCSAPSTRDEVMTRVALEDFVNPL